MQSEKFDKRTREAAEHHHPAYDEQAWDKMEKLLDKHLPQKEEKKRRLLFFILFFLLLGGGFFIYRGITGSSTENKLTRQQDTQQSKIPSGDIHTSETKEISRNDQDISSREPGDQRNQNEQVDQDQVIDDASSLTPTTSSDGEQPGNRTKLDKGNEIASARSSIQQDKPHQKPRSNKLSLSSNQVNKTDNLFVQKKNKNNTRKQQENDPVVADNIITKEVAIQNPIAGKEKNVNDKNRNELLIANEKSDQKTNEVVTLENKPDQQKENATSNTESKTEKKDSAVTVKSPVKKPQKKNSQANALYVSVSAGPDVSQVGDNKIGKTRLVTGLGLSYVIKNRFSINTGFYSARKIYSAKPADYKAPPEFYQSYPYLEKVDANCRVFEIPLSVAYHFGKKENSKWFVSAGVSSFLMNEEGYNYFYKYTPTGNTYTNFWKVKNENAHYFTVGTLSAGYKRNIGKNFFVAAEPYLKVPFSGVGYGKVKLNSGGVLFTVGMKVF